MGTSTTQQTNFTRDVLGRYLCNSLDEALRSTDTTLRADARPFDIIIVGGGTFGSVIAEHMFFRDKAHSHRILVLEGGPFVLPEHVQNLPMLGLDPASATSIQQLKNEGNFGPDKPRNEVWGLAWNSATPFPGLAYCIGGRSLFWGGWSPQLLTSELPNNKWPADVLIDLQSNNLPDGSGGYFRQASDQIGVTQTNDFIFGELHNALRIQLYQGLKAGKVTDAMNLTTLPDHPSVRFSDQSLTVKDLLDLLGLSNQSNPPSQQELLNQLKLEAPLAVQGNPGHAGFFPFNKFSAVPVLMKAAREAFFESNGDDVKKRLMVVPRCGVQRLRTIQDGNFRRVTDIETSQGVISLPPNAIVIIALGTIESTRLALNSFGDIPSDGYNLIGTNLMAHLRTNLDIRIPRQVLSALDPNVQALQSSALFVKGQHQFGDGTLGHFHLQITASGLGQLGSNSEAELFKKVPDIDSFYTFKNATDTHVILTIRGIGEMQPDNPDNFVRLDVNPNETDEFGVQRAFVAIANPQDPQQRNNNTKSAKDFELLLAMEKAADDVTKFFAGNSPVEILGKRRDGLGTTHHETGTLRMGDDPTQSVTNSDGRFHYVNNAYVVGPALFPTIGSPNPMLTGVALARRLGDRLASPKPFIPEPSFTALFDGLGLNNWQMVGQGGFNIVDGTLASMNNGNDLGLLWCKTPMPADFALKLEWRTWQIDSNSGVFIRFPDPNSKGYNNPAWVGVHFGFEVQIDELGTPDGLAIHRTGAIYNEPNQTRNVIPANPPGQWNDFEIRAQGQNYSVFLNGTQVTQFQNQNPNRGLPTTTNAPSFIGLQAYVGKRVDFRNIQIKSLVGAPQPVLMSV